jgi:hypothetical protein
MGLRSFEPGRPVRHYLYDKEYGLGVVLEEATMYVGPSGRRVSWANCKDWGDAREYTDVPVSSLIAICKACGCASTEHDTRRGNKCLFGPGVWT